MEYWSVGLGLTIGVWVTSQLLNCNQHSAKSEPTLTEVMSLRLHQPLIIRNTLSRVTPSLADASATGGSVKTCV